MKENEPGPARNTPTEANRENPTNIPVVGHEDSEGAGANNGTSERQKQWQEEIQEGEREKDRTSENNSTMPMDADDTIGIP